MARAPMVTRTITTTKAKIMCLNIATGESETVEVNLPRTYKDDASLLKVAKAQIETNDTLKAVHVVSKEEVETLYGMTEQDFINKAEILPPRIKEN